MSGLHQQLRRRGQAATHRRALTLAHLLLQHDQLIENDAVLLLMKHNSHRGHVGAAQYQLPARLPATPGRTCLDLDSPMDLTKSKKSFDRWPPDMLTKQR